MCISKLSPNSTPAKDVIFPCKGSVRHRCLWQFYSKCMPNGHIAVAALQEDDSHDATSLLQHAMAQNILHVICMSSARDQRKKKF
jgi:hypothetical protein